MKNKKNIFIAALAILCLVAATMLFLYQYYKPDNSEAQPSAAVSSALLEYDSLGNYTVSTGEGSIHYYFFCSEKSNNCRYVEESIMTPLSSSAGEQAFNSLEYIDITSLVDNLETNRLKDDWGISNFPAFVAVSVQNGTPVVNSSLVWQDDAPISQVDLQQWMIDNGIWKGTVDSSQEQIAQPTE